MVKVEEIWGERARLDPLAIFFMQMFEEMRLYDLKPLKLVPKSRNYISWKDRISNRLDRFMVAENIMQEVGKMKSRIVEGGV